MWNFFYDSTHGYDSPALGLFYTRCLLYRITINLLAYVERKKGYSIKGTDYHRE